MNRKATYIIYLAVGLFVFGTKHSFSQFTITSANLIKPGDSISWSKLDTSGLNLGLSGANVLWDYSTVNVLQPNISSSTYNYSANSICFANPINISVTGWYPPPGYSYSYYISDSTQFSFVGFCRYNPTIPVTDQYILSDPHAYMVAPLSFQDSAVDPFYGIRYSGMINNDTLNVAGYRTFDYDSFGELRLPWGVFQNVARINVSYFQKDSMVASNSNLGDVTIYTGNGYEWYDENSRGNILVYYEHTLTTIPASGTTTTSKSVLLYAQTNNIPVGISSHEVKKQLLIFPNPSNGLLKVNLLGQQYIGKQFRLVVNDIQGRTVFYDAFSTNKPIKELDLSFLENGIYIINLIVNQNLYTSKIIIH